MSNLDKFDPDLLDDEQEFEEDEEAIRAAEAELEARDKREGREKVGCLFTDTFQYSVIFVEEHPTLYHVNLLNLTGKTFRCFPFPRNHNLTLERRKRRKWGMERGRHRCSVSSRGNPRPQRGCATRIRSRRVLA